MKNRWLFALRRYRALFTYRADQMLSWHPAAQFIFLLSLSFALIVIAGILIYLAQGQNLGSQETINSSWEGIWWAFLHVADGGTVGGDHGLAGRTIGFIVTIIGVVVFGLVVAFTASAIQERLEALRRGQSIVLERNHVLILGWSTKTTVIAKELALWAKENKSRRRLPFVILAQKPKEAMEAYIKRRLTQKELKLLTIVCRTGDPSSPTDLEMVRAHYARSIIVLARTGENREAKIIKILLALRRERSQHEEHQHHLSNKRRLVVELAYNTDTQLLKAAEHGAPDIDLEIFEGHEFIARLLVQTMRECGLSEIYQELLSFEGNEFYLTDLPRHCAGHPFEALLTSFPKACLVGISRQTGHQHKRSVLLVPKPEEIIQPTDKLVVIAQDEEAALDFIGPNTHERPRAIKPPPSDQRPERILLVGWRRELPSLFAWMDRLFPKGTEVILLTDHPDARARQALEDHPYHRIIVKVIEGDPTQLEVLAQSGAGTCDQAVILADRSIQKGDPDSRALISLLHLRRLAERTGKPSRRISELIDARTKSLAEETQANDVILSNEIIGMALAQLATEDDRSEVFRELLDPKGARLSLSPATRYAARHEQLSFAKLVHLAYAQSEIAVGIYLSDEPQGKRVRLNPPKEESFEISESCKLIILEINLTEDPAPSDETPGAS